MNTIVKLKAIVVLSLGVLVYGIWGWRFFQPAEPGAAVSLVSGAINGANIGMGILLAVLLAGLGSIFCRSAGEHIGPLAVPAGLTALSIRSGGMDRLLIEHVGNARPAMFYGMMAEVLLWGSFVAVGFGVAWIVRRMVISSSQVSIEVPDKNDQNQDKTTSKKSKSQRTVQHGGGFWKHSTGNRTTNGLTAAAFCSIVTLLLLLILTQTETESIQIQSEIESVATFENIQVAGPPPAQQIIFATGIAFFLATLASHQLFGVRLRWFLLCPVLVSFLAYALGAYKAVLPAVDIPPQFLPRSILFATILPVQFVGIGVLTIAIGYWYSFDIRSHRKNPDFSM